jgi:predicted outer membrane repeat protein
LSVILEKERIMRTAAKIFMTLTLAIAGSLFSADVWSGYVNLTKDYILNDHETLEIMPGTVIRVSHSARIIVSGGNIIALGEKDKKIKFTSYEPEFSEFDFWGGIDFENANIDTSKFRYCIIENIYRKDGKGSINAISSLVNFENCEIRNNSSISGGAIYSDNTLLRMTGNRIENNSADYMGGGIYVNNSGEKFAQCYLIKNLFYGNRVEYSGADPRFGGGAIYIDESYGITSYVLIQENDIISNRVYDRGEIAGKGGGIKITTREYSTVDFIGNKVMYNKAYFSGGMHIEHQTDGGISPHKFTNNIVSNNTSYKNSGGVLYIVNKLKNPDYIKFENNNILNNINLDSKDGSGGMLMVFDSAMNNYFTVKNSILWGNLGGTIIKDIASYPQLYPGYFVRYSNTTNYIEGEGNMSANSLFQRPVSYQGADPYENYLRADYHISLESPCVDAGDPNTESFEPDKSRVNIGAYGNTQEAALTKDAYQTILYTKPIEQIFIKRGEAVLLDCRNLKEAASINNLIIEDGGQIFLASSSSTPVINIKTLETYGKKVGDRYTTKIQRMTISQGNEFPYNTLQVQNINCTGAQFNEMNLAVVSGNPSTLKDSHIYVSQYNSALSGVSIDSPESDVENNIIDNFGIGIYYGGPKKDGKASRTGRITNNTVSFDAAESTKEPKAKGIVVENASADVSGNSVVNPNEGIEACNASGRMTNNTVSFDASESTKAGTLKKAINIYNGSQYEVDHNKIYCDDGITSSIAAIEVHNSYINCHYNTIRFGDFDPGRNDRYAFFTENLGDNSIFINNTVYNSDLGVTDLSNQFYLSLINNIFYGKVQTYITSDRRNLLLYNNDIVGTINWSAVKYEESTLSQDPLFQSTKVNDYYLWKSSPCINTGRYEPDYHVYGVNYYGTAPDIGSTEFYQESSFYAPQNISTSISGTTLTISWSAVPDAVSYNIYGSNDPYGTFSFIKGLTGTSWSSSTAAAKYFYRVTASRDGVKDMAGIENTIEEEATSSGTTKKKINIRKKENLK